jgi:hypothetical protein
MLGSDGTPCAGTPSVGPFRVQVVESTYQPGVDPTGAEVPDPTPPARSTLLWSEYFEFRAGEQALPDSIVALRHYMRGDLDILEWDTVFEGGQLLLSEHQVTFGSESNGGAHCKAIWRERPLGQGAAHTVIAESTAGDGDWHVLRYGLRSEAHGTATRLTTLGVPVLTRLGLFELGRAGDPVAGELALWSGELGNWLPGQVRTIDLNASASLEHLIPGLSTPRLVVWTSNESSGSLAFEWNGEHCLGLQTRHRGPWARPLHPDLWRRLDSKWRREAPVQDPGARARAIQATAPFFDKREHKVPTWHHM